MHCQVCLSSFAVSCWLRFFDPASPTRHPHRRRGCRLDGRRAASKCHISSRVSGIGRQFCHRCKRRAHSADRKRCSVRFFLSANAAYLDGLVDPGADHERILALDYAHGELGHRLAGSRALTHLRIYAAPPYGSSAFPIPNSLLTAGGPTERLTKLGLVGFRTSKNCLWRKCPADLAAFQSGNADAVITSWSILYNRGGYSIDASLHDPIIQRGGVLTLERANSDCRSGRF